MQLLPTPPPFFFSFPYSFCFLPYFFSLVAPAPWNCVNPYSTNTFCLRSSTSLRLGWQLTKALFLFSSKEILMVPPLSSKAGISVPYAKTTDHQLYLHVLACLPASTLRDCQPSLFKLDTEIPLRLGKCNENLHPLIRRKDGLPGPPELTFPLTRRSHPLPFTIFSPLHNPPFFSVWDTQ